MRASSGMRTASWLSKMLRKLTGPPSVGTLMFQDGINVSSGASMIAGTVNRYVVVMEHEAGGAVVSVDVDDVLDVRVDDRRTPFGEPVKSADTVGVFGAFGHFACP